MRHSVTVKADQKKLELDLDYCKTRFGHRGQENGWWWKVRDKWKDKVFVFSFEEEADALAFKLARGT